MLKAVIVGGIGTSAVSPTAASTGTADDITAALPLRIAYLCLCFDLGIDSTLSRQYVA
jgi:hypothetical protein